MARGWREDLLDSALAASARFPVFPLRPGAKAPAFEDWQQRASRDRRVIRSWWRARPYNVGILTGGHLLVVDLDIPKGDAPPDRSQRVRELRRGRLSHLARQNGDTRIWDTYTVETQSSGLHLYFWVSDDDQRCCRNTHGLIGPHVDTRGEGGLVVGAGSRTPNGIYRAVVHRPIATAPTWLTDLLRPPAPPLPTRGVTITGTASLSRWVAAAVRDECASVAAAEPGTRNVRLLRGARTLGELVGAGALGAETAAAALRQAASGHIGVAGCTTGEVEATIASGLRYGTARPRDLRTR